MGRNGEEKIYSHHVRFTPVFHIVPLSNIVAGGQVGTERPGPQGLTVPTAGGQPLAAWPVRWNGERLNSGYRPRLYGSRRVVD